MTECYECGKGISEEKAQNVLVEVGVDGEGNIVAGFAPHCPTCFEEEVGT